MVRSDFGFARETATEAAALPHAFTQAEKGSECRMCQAPQSDARHVAFLRDELSQREKAHGEGAIQRETGS